MDMGAFVVVINAEKVQVSGNKFDDKMYFNQHYNGKPGSAKMEAFKDLQKVRAEHCACIGYTPHTVSIPPDCMLPRVDSVPSIAAQRIPERIIERAVQGMLPKGSLGRDIRLHLKVGRGLGCVRMTAWGHLSGSSWLAWTFEL